MAEGFSQTILTGNLGADPDLRGSGGGRSVLKLRLATSKSFLDKDKQRKEHTEWHSVVVFGKRAETLAGMLAKGSRIQIIGENRTTSFDKDGQKHYRTEVHANSIILCGGDRASGGAPRTAPTSHETSKANGYTDEDFGPTAADDDFPF